MTARGWVFPIHRARIERDGAGNVAVHPGALVAIGYSACRTPENAVAIEQQRRSLCFWLGAEGDAEG